MKNFAKKCMRDFPSIKKFWEKSNIKSIEIKYRSIWNSELDIPENMVCLVRILNLHFSQSFVKSFQFLKIMPDPYFTGGGLNITERGGLLDVHVDGNYHDASGLNRRLNILIYFNPGWKKSWGGEFEFILITEKNASKRFEPLFNRMIAFDTHDYSFHGLPNPINFPKIKHENHSFYIIIQEKNDLKNKQRYLNLTVHYG